MGGANAKLLKKVDDAAAGSVGKYVDRLFEEYDQDKSGFVEGEEYAKFVADCTTYMVNDLKKLGHEYSEEDIKSWITQWVDPDSNGKISRAELHANLPGVLNAGET
eukprot:GFYU01014408.1.p1 GENE.GFYU01014408.1~~GFYU01014408.1.p1  ORF type:complete len:106 (-),score=35.56 GFYU01014408.1:164-481(-)